MIPIRNNLKKVSKEGRYRLSVSRSSKNISAQIIDDINNKTLISASSQEKDIKTLNKTLELLLKNASLAISGIYTAADDGVLNPNNIRITPGAIIPSIEVFSLVPRFPF